MTRHGQRRREPASHADDWLMTYADTITLLLCLFVVFVIVSSSRQHLQQRAPLPALPEVAEVMEQMPPPLPPPPRQAVAPRPDVAASAVADSRLPVQDGDKDKARAKEAAAAAATAIDEPAAPRKAAVAAAVSAVKADDAPSRPLAIIPPPELVGSLASQDTAAAAVAPKGDRITTLDMGSAAFFDSGSASLSDSGKAILHGVLARLAAALGEGYRIKVEGHTDDTPIDTAQFPSNWELSTARAAAVVHFFIEQGIPAQRLRAIGYADTEPKVPNRDAAGNAIPGNQAQNRRVIIKLEKIETPGR